MCPSESMPARRSRSRRHRPGPDGRAAASLPDSARHPTSRLAIGLPPGRARISPNRSGSLSKSRRLPHADDHVLHSGASPEQLCGAEPRDIRVVQVAKETGRHRGSSARGTRSPATSDWLRAGPDAAHRDRALRTAASTAEPVHQRDPGLAARGRPPCWHSAIAEHWQLASLFDRVFWTYESSISHTYEHRRMSCPISRSRRPTELKTRNVYICYVTLLKTISDAELARRIRLLRVEQLRRAGKTHICARCGMAFHARSGARYCSGACRVAAFRARAARPESGKALP